MNETESRLCDAEGMADLLEAMARADRRASVRGVAAAAGGHPDPGRPDRATARRAAAADRRRRGPRRRGRHHPVPRRPGRGRPLARPARDRHPVRGRGGGDRPGRRRPLHRPDRPRGAERRLRPGPARRASAWRPWSIAADARSPSRPTSSACASRPSAGSGSGSGSGRSTRWTRSCGSAAHRADRGRGSPPRRRRVRQSGRSASS